MKIPTEKYLSERLAQLEAAVKLHDGSAAGSVLQLIRDDGYPEAADMIETQLIEQGLKNLAAAVLAHASTAGGGLS